MSRSRSEACSLQVTRSPPVGHSPDLCGSPNQRLERFQVLNVKFASKSHGNQDTHDHNCWVHMYLPWPSTAACTHLHCRFCRSVANSVGGSATPVVCDLGTVSVAHHGVSSLVPHLRSIVSQNGCLTPGFLNSSCCLLGSRPGCCEEVLEAGQGRDFC